MLSAGDHLGSCKILALIGSGGMGQVYKAVDTQLKREIALKTLLPAYANDPERFARFQREAEVLASLNHPNIATLYGITEGALVMEFVEGESLPCPLPVDTAIEYARQIVEALEYAHERGVIHRDLKPANIKVTPEGVVKLLDFGLAKALDNAPVPAASDVANSPTLTLSHTLAGQILGTAAYMAPEQVEGRAADRRADIWSFGAVLFEMLTGKRAFEGSTSVETLASVMKLDPDWSALGADTPQHAETLIRRCLMKDRKQRLQAIGEARIALESHPAPAARPAEAPAAKLRTGFFPWAAAAVFALLAATVSLLHFREHPPDPPKAVRFQLSPENVSIGAPFRFALSPDGTKLAYFATGTGTATESYGPTRLWIRSLDTLEARPLPATDLRPTVPIFWSFDSKFVVFQSPGKLKKIDVSGGPPQTLCDVTGTVVAGSWNRDGVIIFGGNNGPLMQVSSEGGTATPVTALDPARGETLHIGPVFLPDGRHFLYGRAGKPESQGIYIGSLDEKPGQTPPKRLLATDFDVKFVPAPEGDSGKVLFLREGTLLAQSFDLRKLELSGDAVPVAEQVANFIGYGQFSASKSGALVYRGGGDVSYAKLTWFDRHGKNLGTIADANYTTGTLALSPDGSRVATTRAIGRNLNLWLLELERGGQTRFTFSQSSSDAYAAWSPDGALIAFSSSRAGHFDLYQHSGNGAGEDELLLKSNIDKIVYDWSRDGRFLMYSERNSQGLNELWLLPMSGDGERKPIPFLRANFDQREGRFSPDGRWVAYRSTESGRSEIYVRPFPPPPGGGGKWMISQGGGNLPHWSRDGKELFYVIDGQVMVSEVNASGSAFQPGTPKLLFKGVGLTTFDVSADGTRFLFPILGAEMTGVPFTVVLNWMALLKK